MFSCLFLGISYFPSDILKWMWPQRALEGVRVYFGRMGPTVCFFFLGICGPHPGSVSCEAAVTSVIWVSLLSGRGCQRYGRTLMFFWVDPGSSSGSQCQRGEERRAPGLQGLMKDNICLIPCVWRKQKTLVCQQWLQVLQVHKYIEVINTGRKRKWTRKRERSFSNATGQIRSVGVTSYRIQSRLSRLF